MAMLLNIVSKIDATERTLALDRFLSRLDTSELPEMLAHLCSQRFSSEAERQAFVSAQEMMLTAWTKVDPRAAVESATNPSRPYAGFMGPQIELQTIASLWAARDADAAIAWAKARPPVSATPWEEDPFMVGLIRTISAQDREKATALLVEMPYGQGRRSALSSMISDVFASGRDEAAAWIDTLADEKLRKGANNMIADRLADEDPHAAVDWIVTRMGGDTDHTSIDTIMKRWLGKDQEDALVGFDSIPEGRVRADAFAVITLHLYRQNQPPEAADWIIDRLPSGSIPGSGEDWVYKRWFQRDPAAAFSHWQTLPDHVAIPAYRRVIENFATKDIGQASAFYLENLGRMNPYNSDDLLEKMDNAAADTFVDEISRRDPAAWRKVMVERPPEELDR